MKLWEIKAQALRLMFTDFDIQFNETDFTDGTIYSNPNTRDKLVRMQDSIQRAINLYYQQVGSTTAVEVFDAVENFELTVGEYPKRIDVLVYETVNEETVLRKEIRDVSFTFDELTNLVYFFDVDYLKEYEEYDVKYRIMYLRSGLVIGTENELTYDLNEQNIPQDIQFMIPYFVKGELYEEEDPQIALQARQLYMQFLMGVRKPFGNVQTKVKSSNVFKK